VRVEGSVDYGLVRAGRVGASWGDNRAAHEHTDLDCRRCDRSGAWLHGAQCTLVQTKLEQSPLSGQVFVFRGRRGDLLKVLWFDGDGLERSSVRDRG
jgi:hypothetical protein